MLHGKHPLAVALGLLVAGMVSIPYRTPGQENSRASDAPAPEASESAEQKIQRALDATTSFDLEETPLRDFVKQLRRQTKLNILVDRKALDDVGLSDDVPLTGELREISLRSVLRILLHSRDLAWTMEDGALVITTPEQAESRQCTKVYNVADLITAQSDEEESQQVDALLQVITSTIRPSTWDEVGGPATIGYLHRAILVAQTEDLHSEIAALLQALREAANATTAAGAEPPRKSIRLASKTEEDILAALAKPVTLELEAAPLHELPAVLREKLGLQAILDTKAFDDVGITPDAQVSLSVAEMPAEQALSHLLRTADLTWRVANEVLVITTPEAAEAELEIRIYPVRDLCEFREELNNFTGKLLGRRDDDLTNALTRTISPDTWADVGGPGSLAPLPGTGVLVVAQTAEIHRKIEDFLAQLRRTLDKQDAPAAAEKGDPDALTLVVYELPMPLPAQGATLPQNPAGGEQANPAPGGLFNFGGWGALFGAPIPGDDLVEIVTLLIEPDSWDRPGAYIKAVPGRLIVRQTPEVHHKIEDLLVRLGVRTSDYGFGGTTIPAVGSRSGPRR